MERAPDLLTLEPVEQRRTMGEGVEIENLFVWLQRY